jgi:molybdopterin-containing oxidoreductase family iron-sulfur binding subunit
MTVNGKEYWRSLEELAQTPEFQELVERKYPSQVDMLIDPLSRRRFLTLMAASLGLAGLNGCSPAPSPQERIVPYVRPPEQLVLGRPLYFATTMPLGCDALGLLVESHEGRPTKVEGNPDHPSSPRPPGSPERVKFGASDVFAQASILTLYDPERSPAVAHIGEDSTFDAFLAAFVQMQRGRRDLKLRILTETITSPCLAWQLQLLLRAFPAAKWHVFDPIGREQVRAGAQLAFGQVVEPQYHLQRAEVIVSLDADFLDSGPGRVRHLHDFALRRRKRPGQDDPINRLYVVESIPSGTGTIADHRQPVRAAHIETVARALAARVNPQRFGELSGSGSLPVPAAWLEAAARDLRLQQHRVKSLVIAGDRQPAAVHALAHALNEFLGNVGKTVTYTALPEYAPPPDGSLAELCEALDSPGNVDVLVILGGNPVYTAPVDLRFAQRMSRVPFRVHLGLYRDETAQLCHWHIPEAHFLEAWGDARAKDGTVSFIQPLIAPLHGGKTAGEVISHLYTYGNQSEVDPQDDRSAYAILRSYWRSLFDATSRSHQAVRAEWERQGVLGAFTGAFEPWWQRSLRDGVVAGTKLPTKTVTADVARIPPQQTVSSALEIVFQPDQALYDGRFANNGWLQELPRPQSKLTWDNAAYLSAATAVRLGLAREGHPAEANEKVVALQIPGGPTVSAPVWVLPGQADNSVTVHLGHGRTHAGRVGNNVGFNAYLLRTAAAPWFNTNLTLVVLGQRKSLACTQHHQLLGDSLQAGGRDIIRSGTVQDPPSPASAPRISLYNENEHLHAPNQWAMVIDLGLCTGCSACVVACQAENNIPVVGKDQVMRGREMHWLRIDHYYKGEPANPQMFFQPVPCMHCENAPCELVCPVSATVHSEDGLNDMVYNRCVGTRYCSNNCPYKVRRFNFLQYADFASDSLRLMRNPEVTVRSRGVMEKCTYCVQRIRTGQIAAQRDNRPLQDGEIVTACQAACPAGAIVFGDKNNAQAHVSRLRAEPWHYALLDELNTRPRTTYLAALKNPNPSL